MDSIQRILQAGRVAARFMEAGTLPSWNPGLPSQRVQMARDAFKNEVGANLQKMQTLAKGLGSFFKKHPLFEGYRVDVSDKGILGGDYGWVSWEADVLLDSYATLRVTVNSGIKTNQAPYGGIINYQLQAPAYNLILFPSGGRSQTIFHGATVPSPAVCKKALESFTLEKILNAVGGPKKGSFKGQVSIDEVKKVIARLNTWFDLESETHDSLSYASREYGDVGDEQPGAADVKEASRIIQALREQFGAAVKSERMIVDEWVNIDITIP